MIVNCEKEKTLYQEMTQKLAALLESSCHYYNLYKKASQMTDSDQKKQNKPDFSQKSKYEKLIIETNEDDICFSKEQVINC